MPLQIGIIGLPNVGKSTLFNALVRSRSAAAASYPFTTIEANVGMVEVPDERLAAIATIVKPEKVVPTTIRFVDIAGLVAGASRGEGLGNQFLSHIREVDAICEVVRLFPDGNVVHVEGSIDGKRDVETVHTELILADLQTVTKRIEKVHGAARTGEKEAKIQLEALRVVKDALDQGRLAATVTLTHEQGDMIRELHLLTRKPLLYAINVAEDQLGTLSTGEVQKRVGVGGGVVIVCAKLEEELMTLSGAEAQEYREGMGVKESGIDQLIHAAYDVLGLITFFTTTGGKECRAWTVKRGTKAPEAAGVIHTDFQRGFICADVVTYQDFTACGGEHGVREKGKMRTEGKEYVVRDGDIMHFRYNV